MNENEFVVNGNGNTGTGDNENREAIRTGTLDDGRIWSVVEVFELNRSGEWVSSAPMRLFNDDGEADSYLQGLRAEWCLDAASRERQFRVRMMTSEALFDWLKSGRKERHG